MFDRIGEWLYANTSSEYEDNAQLHRDVAEGQAARYNQLTQQGVIDPISNFFYQREIKSVGEMTANERDKDKSWWNFFAGTWFIWLVLALVVFWYFGGFRWLKGKLTLA